MKVKEVELASILKELPNIVPLDCKKDFGKTNQDFYLCALGFEERCLTIPEELAEHNGLKCEQALIFEYSTNVGNNAANRPRLINALQRFVTNSDSMQCDSEDFLRNLREHLKAKVEHKGKASVILDISVFSSKLLLGVMKVLLDFDVTLHLVYSEAAVYHPTAEEFGAEQGRWTSEEGFGLTRGVGRVVLIPEYAGARRENPNLIIVFPTFKPERTKAIIASIDETLLARPDDRIIWIIGDPHMNEQGRAERKAMLHAINQIPESAPAYEVSTFDYKQTLALLERIYRLKNLEFHINVAALGSKMQSLAIPIFTHMRPDISVYCATPVEYNPFQYSEGCKAVWYIGFGELGRIRSILNKVGRLELMANAVQLDGAQ